MRLPGRKKVLLLTCYWLWDEIYWTTVVEMKGGITHKLLVIKWDYLTEKWRASSLTCYKQWNEMRWDCLNKKRAPSLTFYRSWGDMWWDCLGGKEGTTTHQLWSWNEMYCHEAARERKRIVTHSLLRVMGWDVMRLLGGKNLKGHCHTPPVGWSKM